MKIGIDLGSTYSAFSYFDEEMQDVQSLSPSQVAGPYIPSVVAISKRRAGAYSFGSNAKEKTGSNAFYSFEAFKMMLTEKNPKVLKKYHYNDKNTPQRITELFLSYYLENLPKTIEDISVKSEEIDSAVICVPEVWGNRKESLDGRGILLDIMKHIFSEKETTPRLRIVTEPEAASAYFAYHYEKATKSAFNGHLILIDYGGGTLDLTLSRVSSNGHGEMEITYVDSDGEGTNHPDAGGNVSIGHAGISYMQTVVRIAMEEKGLIDPNDDSVISTDEFMRVVYALESDMKDQENWKAIHNKFGIYRRYRKFRDILDVEIRNKETGDYDENWVFCEAVYKDDIVEITYQHLFRAYQEAIEPVLAAAVADINRKVMASTGKDPTDPEAGNDDTLKIAIVGGFGSCYFVNAQLNEIYNIDPNKNLDMRFRNLPLDKKELAISYGAALIAADKVKLRKTARFSIGIYVPQENYFEYGIYFHQIVVPREKYFILNDPEKEDTADNRHNYAALKGNIEGLVVEFSENRRHGGLCTLRPEKAFQLNSQLPELGAWNCGFSMDENENLFLHLMPSPAFNPHEKPIEIRLGRYGELFDINTPDEVNR